MAKIKSANTQKEYGVLNAGAFGIALDRFTGKVEMHLRQKIARVFLEAYVDILNDTPVAVSYTHLTLPTTPYV